MSCHDVSSVTRFWSNYGWVEIREIRNDQKSVSWVAFTDIASNCIFARSVHMTVIKNCCFVLFSRIIIGCLIRIGPINSFCISISWTLIEIFAVLTIIIKALSQFLLEQSGYRSFIVELFKFLEFQYKILILKIRLWKTKTQIHVILATRKYTAYMPNIAKQLFIINSRLVKNVASSSIVIDSY